MTQSQHRMLDRSSKEGVREDGAWKPNFWVISGYFCITPVIFVVISFNCDSAIRNFRQFLLVSLYLISLGSFKDPFGNYPFYPFYKI